MIAFYYLLAVNFIGAVFVLADKRRAKKGAWRVPERTFWLFCIAGGCPGIYLAMRGVRHKTRHKRFMVGIPAVFILQIVVIMLFKYYL